MASSVTIDDKSIGEFTRFVQYCTEHPSTLIPFFLILAGLAILWKFLQWNPNEKRYQVLLAANNQKLGEIKSELVFISRSQERYIQVVQEIKDQVVRGFAQQGQ